ncbi:CIR protein [Plasmodium chabaudi adami]|uniref:CIR protein n=1 Tax=Plasmodium chabaudi adami TaxID=5826 RepID=A0A1C6WGM8_PLACE|nr:CIR protein [Plasmodium chabaudi adami]
MTNSSDNLKDLYKEFATIDGYFYVVNDDKFRVDTEHTSILQYCNYENTSGTYNCNDYFQLAICSVIHLLKKYKYKLEDDKLAEYVILWLSYKLNTVEDKCSTNLNDFYTNHIEKNEYYNKNIKNDDTTTYKDIIDKIKNLMNTKEISKFNDPFSILFYLYNVFHDKSLNCKQYSGKANEFAKEFEKLNNDSNNKENSLYTQILSTLSNDYKNLKNKCPQFQSLSEIKKLQSSAENSVEDLGKVSGQPTALIPEGTSSSSSILKTVIPGLSTFAIPVFLGVAYKYSLFGFDKLFQRQYIRNKLKKIKNKMELNI